MAGVAEDVTIIIPVYGDHDRWMPLARRAAGSAITQTVPPARVFISAGETLSAARNGAAEWARTEWLCFLDADDELDVRYVEAMLAAEGDVRQPATLGIDAQGQEDPLPVVIPAKPFMYGNYIVIGAFVRTQLFFDVGGFRELPAYEDWDLWIRCWLAGAQIGVAPEAIYRVHASTGRNSLPRRDAVATFRLIHDRYVGQVPRTWSPA